MMQNQSFRSNGIYTKSSNSGDSRIILNYEKKTYSEKEKLIPPKPMINRKPSAASWIKEES
jgi:hypothetical protein